MTGVRGRIAGRETVGSRQRPHTAKSQKQYAALAAAVWAQLEAEQAAKVQQQTAAQAA